MPIDINFLAGLDHSFRPLLLFLNQHKYNHQFRLNSLRSKKPRYSLAQSGDSHQASLQQSLSILVIISAFSFHAYQVSIYFSQSMLSKLYLLIQAYCKFASKFF